MYRLSFDEVQNLKSSLNSFDNSASIYLFGSRADSTKRGGDIDILIVSEKIDRKAVRKIRRIFFDEFGEQKLDIIVESSLQNLTPFGDEVIKKAVKL